MCDRIKEPHEGDDADVADLAKIKVAQANEIL